MSPEKSLHLNVDPLRQTKNYTCVPSCTKMMLDYLNNVKLTVPELDLNEDEIAKIMKTTTGGTIFTDIENINDHLTKSNPSLEFIAEEKNHTLNDIKKELKDELPVSVWIDTGYIKYRHSVVITGIDDNNKTISFNDPTYGEERTIPQSEFMSMWNKADALMIKAQIGRINRDKLDKWF